MKRKWFVARSSAVLILVSAVLGTLGPLPARAAPSLQEGTDTWGSFTIAAPDRGQLVISPEPPALSAKQEADMEQAARFSHLSGPTTPTDPDATIIEGPPGLGPTDPGGELAAQAPTSLAIFSNDALAGATGIDLTGQTVEPSAANNGRSVLVSYNYYAALSTDYGGTWSYTNPTTVAPGGDGTHGGFVGDQDVIYDPSRDLMIWTLRYIPDATGNQLRLVVFNGRTALDAMDYLALTLTPEGKCAGTDTADWFDAPQLALTSNYLYVSANVFRFPTNAFTCSIVMRIPLQNLDAGPFYDTTNNLYYSSSVRSLTGAHGGTHTFYFAGHVDNDTLRIYDWPESATAGAVTSADVNHASYLTGVVHDCTVTGTGVNPCAGDGDGITDGWLRRDLNQLGFMWDAPQGTDGTGTFPYPYVRALVVDATTKALVTDDYVWNPDGAFFLPSAAVNARGHVGGTYAFAGDVTGAGTGPYYPQCDAWLYDDVTSANYGDWTLADSGGVASGTGNPTGNRWGDYLRTRMSGLNPFQWIGTCYAMEAGVPVTRVARFGRERDRYSRMKVDFNVDGKTDVSVFRDGVWFVRDQFVAGWGLAGDVPIPSDFNGDGRADVAVYRPSTGGWRIKDQFVVAYGGIPGDVPVPGDYDGDGDADVAIYRSSTAGWYIKDQFLVGYGLPTDIPVPGDYDGDGVTDIAVYRDGTWYIRNQAIIAWGVAGDIPVPADYNNDGITDLAIYRPSTGGWRVKDQFVVAYGGVAGDLPVPGDFNADGKTDLAIYRTSTAGWYVKDQFTVAYGLSTDWPLPAPDTNGDGDPYQ